MVYRHRDQYLRVSFITVDTQDEDAAAMTRARQDLLANIRILATDNSINFNAGEDGRETKLNLQLQPERGIII